MKELLTALNKPYCLREKITLFSLMFFVVVIFLMLLDFIYIITGIPMHNIQLFAWVIWFIWQGYFFVKHREGYQKKFPENPYRAAYYRDILFGVAFGISQMIRPFYHGVLHGTIIHEWYAWALFIGLIGVGIGLMISGFSVIGFAAAGFLYEFKKPANTESFLLESGIYKLIRHPLFLGGTIASLGCGMIFSFDAMVLGIVNMGILPIYHLVENHRQTKVLGQQYIEYRSRVSAFLPNLSGINVSLLESFKKKKGPSKISVPEHTQMNVKPSSMDYEL